MVCSSYLQLCMQGILSPLSLNGNASANTFLTMLLIRFVIHLVPTPPDAQYSCMLLLLYIHHSRHTSTWVDTVCDECGRYNLH